jgi:HAD superfamily hydrolase (TIGR01509 family)
MIRALVFDVDGTMAETEELHRSAFNEAFAEAGLDWRWDRDLYKDLLRVTGGRERILAYGGRIGQAVDAVALHRRKTDIYNARIRDGGISLRPGVALLIERAHREGLVLAIGTTTSRRNVLSLLDATLGIGTAHLFSSIRTGEDVASKKPDPEVYHLVLADLGLPGDDCLCVEDSRNGLLAARAAGLRTLITPSLYSEGEDFSGADVIVRTLEDVSWPPDFDRPTKKLMSATRHASE